MVTHLLSVDASRQSLERCRRDFSTWCDIKLKFLSKACVYDLEQKENTKSLKATPKEDAVIF